MLGDGLKYLGRVRLHGQHATLAISPPPPSLLQKCYQIINLWRPISDLAYDFPLAPCDYRGVDEARDLVSTTLKYPDYDGELSSVKLSATHRWKYFRGMKPDELVLIK